MVRVARVVAGAEPERLRARRASGLIDPILHTTQKRMSDTTVKGKTVPDRSEAAGVEVVLVEQRDEALRVRVRALTASDACAEGESVTQRSSRGK